MPAQAFGALLIAACLEQKLWLAKHGIHLQLAKISTLGERMEDTLLVSGAALQPV